MTYRWSKSDVEKHLNHISEGKQYNDECMICTDLYSILVGMELTGQKYVYIKGQPEY